MAVTGRELRALTRLASGRACCLLLALFLLQAAGLARATAPSITNFSPTSGSAGTTVVTINGKNFGATPASNAVTFFGISGRTSATVSSATTKQLVVTVPYASATGTICVSVSGGAQACSSSNFTVTGPTVSGLSPTSGLSGSVLTISGANFDPSVDRVIFHEDAGGYDVPIYPSSATTTQLVVTVPSDVITGPICVAGGGVQGCSGSNFTVPLPTVTGFSPASGPPGTIVTIAGTNFNPIKVYDAALFAGNTSATVNSATATQLIVRTEYYSITGPICVSNGGVTRCSTASFTVPNPVVTGISPTSGPVGTAVTITGANFSLIPTDDEVSFHSASNVVNADSATATQLGATVPSGATTGPICVDTGSGTKGCSASNFTVPVPAVTGFSPTSGQSGTVITITGTNFSATSANNNVTISNQTASVSSATPTQLVVTLMSFNGVGSALTGPICVRVSGGTQGCSSTNFTVPIPTITTFSPPSGQPGTVVTVTGTNFNSNAANDSVQVNINTDFGTPVTSATATQIAFAVDIYATTGPICVHSGAAPGFSTTGCSSSNFAVPAASITGFSPANGAPGTSVTITGTNFSLPPVPNHIQFNNLDAVITSATATQLVAVVPLAATTGPICQHYGTSSQSACSSTNFIVPAATIAGFSPSSGPPGITVTITGTNFSPVAVDNAVTFNGVPATTSSASTTQLSVISPGTASNGPVCLTVGGEPQVCSSNFTVLAPTISGFTPAGGTVGTSVTLTGTNFSPVAVDNIVTFNGQAGTVSSATTTHLSATVPGSASTGPICLTIGLQPQVCAISTFTVAPSISGFTPASGQAGTSVTIFGAKFDPTPANDAVKFNGTAATVTSATSTQLVAVAPAGVTTGPVSVTVGGQITTSTSIFVVQPTINSFTPVTGPSGTSVTISGTNFSSTPANNTVTFNGAVAVVGSASATQLVVTVPAGATTGPIGLAIGGLAIVTNSNFAVTGGSAPVTSYQYDANGRLQQVTPPTGNPSQYAYDALGNMLNITATAAGTLTIFSVSPGQGSAGDAVTINGQGFDVTASNNQVAFNGVAATVLAASATQLVVAVPTGTTTGLVSVAVNSANASSPAPFVVTN